MLAICFYNAQHKYLDDPSYTRPPPATNPSSTSPLTLLTRLQHDERFNGLYPPNDKGDENIAILLASPAHEAAVLEYWNALDVPSDPTRIFESVQRAAVEVLVGTKKGEEEEAVEGEEQEEEDKYDFFLVHTLTTSHALRHLLPSMPARWHVPLVRQWWLLVLTVYVAQHRPGIKRERIDGVELAGRGWAFVVEQALHGRWRNDAHYVKGESSC